MVNIYTHILKSLERTEGAALATIISRTGSAPRAVGAKYLVLKNGSSVGSIGGGCVEAEVWQAAQEVIEKKKEKVLRFKLTAEQLAEGGLICGGNIEILIEPLREDSLSIYREVISIKQRGGLAVLASLLRPDGEEVSGAEGLKSLIKASGEKVGSLPIDPGAEQRVSQEVEALLRSKERNPRVVTLPAKREDPLSRPTEVLLEPIYSEPTVYLFGAGHVSQQIAPLAKRVEFKVVVIDDREMFANRERFPEADEILVSEFATCFEGLSIDDSSYLIIVTRGHLYDGTVLEQAVKTQARYVGMIGSRKKIRLLYENLMKKGVSREMLNRVYAPIGLEIHSETPEEIAVSIVAQLIQVRGGPF